MPKVDPNRLLTVPAAAAEVGLHPDVLWRRVRAGRLAVVEHGRRGRGHVTRIRLSDALEVAQLSRRIEAETVSTGEAAARLGLCARVVRELVARGELPATRRGLAWRFRPLDLERFLAARTREPRAQPFRATHRRP